MLKTISVSSARKGMFVHKFCGSWIDHPFWGRRLLISDDDQLRQILRSRITELVIDVSRGLDVLETGLPPEPASPEVVSQISADSPLPVQRTGRPVTATVQCAMEDELWRARRIVADGKRAIIEVFSDVRMGRAVSAEGLGELIGDMSDSVARNPHALISVARIKHKDEYTYLHSVAVAALMVALARRYGCTEEQVHTAGLAGLLHDLGKAMMPDSILNKPGRLTPEEFEVMRSHPAEGFKLLQQWEGIPEGVLEVCLHHHERMDGAGYPFGLIGEQTGLFARMGSICDVYDAITSNRPYKKGWDPAESLKQMSGWKGHFDPELFRLFVHMLGIYPVGSLVRLSDEHLAVVIEQGTGSLLQPRLSVFYSTRLRQAVPLRLVDLSQSGGKVSIVGRENPERWGLQGLEKLWMPG